MPTTALPTTANPDPLRYSTTGTVLTTTAADVANGNHIASSSNILVIAQNVHASSAYTITITSSADTLYGRTGSVTAQSMAAGEIRYFFLTADGWSDSNDQYLVSASDASIEIGWITA